MDNSRERPTNGASRKSLLVSYTDALFPPIFHVAESMAAAGISHTTLHAPPNGYPTAKELGYRIERFRNLSYPRALRPIQQVQNWRRFRRAVRLSLREQQPDIVLTMMLHATAALPCSKRRFHHGACIYDIPAMEHSGRYDRVIIAQAWKRLRGADFVWASDVLKARLAQEYGNLNEIPLVCHNCPPKGYLPEVPWPRDPWLRAQLRVQGAKIGPSGGCVILRAGAIGPYGGIEETLDALVDMPQDYLLVLMGRPVPDYKKKLITRIAEAKLHNRVFLWDHVSDEEWKMALAGADVGHLIHAGFPLGTMRRLYELNSSLSNNRLYQYMAAGLPIIAYDDPRMNDLYSEVECFRVARVEQLQADLTEILQGLGGDPELRRELGERARQAYRDKYNWEMQFAPVLERIVARPSKTF